MRVPTMSDGMQVGRELQAGEGAAGGPGQRLGGQGLGQAGHALEEAVAPAQQGDEQALDDAVLADDHALDLDVEALESGGDLGGARGEGRGGRGFRLGHRWLLWGRVS